MEAKAKEREEVGMVKEFALEGLCDLCKKHKKVHAAKKQGEWICEECEVNLQFSNLFGKVFPK